MHKNSPLLLYLKLEKCTYIVIYVYTTQTPVVCSTSPSKAVVPVFLWEGLRLVIVAFPGLFSYLFNIKVLVLFLWSPGNLHVTPKSL